MTRSKSATRRSLVALTGLLFLVSGCTVFPDSPPAKLYALNLPAAQAAFSCPVKFAFRDVRVPGYFDRPEVILNTEGSQIALSGQHLWASPVARDITRLMTRGLRERLGGSQAMPYPLRQNERPQWIFDGEITRISIQGESTLVELSLSGLRTDSAGAPNQTSETIGPFYLRAESTSEPGVDKRSASNRAASTAESMNKVLTKILDDMANSLSKKVCA